MIYKILQNNSLCINFDPKYLSNVKVSGLDARAKQFFMKQIKGTFLDTCFYTNSSTRIVLSRFNSRYFVFKHTTLVSVALRSFVASLRFSKKPLVFRNVYATIWRAAGDENNVCRLEALSECNQCALLPECTFIQYVVRQHVWMQGLESVWWGWPDIYNTTTYTTLANITSCSLSWKLRELTRISLRKISNPANL